MVCIVRSLCCPNDAEFFWGVSFTISSNTFNSCDLKGGRYHGFKVHNSKICEYQIERIP